MDGALALWADPIPSSLPGPISSAKTNPVLKPSTKDEKKKTSKLDDLFDDGDDTAMDGDEPDAVLEDKVYDDDDQDWVVNDVGEDFTAEKDKFGAGLREMGMLAHSCCPHILLTRTSPQSMSQRLNQHFNLGLPGLEERNDISVCSSAPLASALRSLNRLHSLQ